MHACKCNHKNITSSGSWHFHVTVVAPKLHWICDSIVSQRLLTSEGKLKMISNSQPLNNILAFTIFKWLIMKGYENKLTYILDSPGVSTF